MEALFRHSGPLWLYPPEHPLLRNFLFVEMFNIQRNWKIKQKIKQHKPAPSSEPVWISIKYVGGPLLAGAGAAATSTFFGGVATLSTGFFSDLSLTLSAIAGAGSGLDSTFLGLSTTGAGTPAVMSILVFLSSSSVSSQRLAWNLNWAERIIYWNYRF